MNLAENLARGLHQVVREAFTNEHRSLPANPPSLETPLL